MAPRVTIVLPSDLASSKIGGIQTFARGFVKYAPEDFVLEHIGITTDAVGAPVGQWTDAQLGERRLRLLPLVAAQAGQRRSRVPVALAFTRELARRRRSLSRTPRVLQFHRPGTTLPFLGSRWATVQVIHLTSGQLTSGRSESRWRRLGPALGALERFTLPRVDRIVAVNEEAAEEYRRRFPALADRIEFLANWFDDEVFGPASPDERAALRERMADELGLGTDGPLLLWAARFDTQKQPLLAIEAFRRLGQPGAGLVMAGDGELRVQAERAVAEAGIADRVRFAGTQRQDQLASLMQAADLFLLSSAHETGPTIALEALASGLPLASTPVGRVPRLLAEGGGELAAQHDASALAASIDRLLAAPAEQRRQEAVRAVDPYRARAVLAPFYEAHRELFAGLDATRDDGDRD
ncbi:MAG TPA: glycosyltransferase [Candidatus Limnocylindria bacterium]|jgi:glycosyltransferase involved in cell wall biosynthesis